MPLSTITTYAASIPPFVIVLLISGGYLFFAAGHWSWPMLLDALLLAIYYVRPATWPAMLLIGVIRHSSWLSDEIARLGNADQAVGMTRAVWLFVLPTLNRYVSIMSRSEDGAGEKSDNPVHVLIPNTLGSADTKAIDDESRRDQFLIRMADERDERGSYLFSANQIHAAIGGHRATVLARVKDRRATTLPPLYRQEDGRTAPAHYPVTKE
mgnify:FL=1